MDTSVKSRAMGTLTGWQMIALEVMDHTHGDGDDDDDGSDNTSNEQSRAASLTGQHTPHHVHGHGQHQHHGHSHDSPTRHPNTASPSLTPRSNLSASPADSPCSLSPNLYQHGGAAGNGSPRDLPAIITDHKSQRKLDAGNACGHGGGGGGHGHGGGHGGAAALGGGGGAGGAVGGASGAGSKESKFQSPIAKSNASFFSDYQLVEEIGAGAFGRAMKAIRIADKELVVVKEVKIGLMSDKERHITKNEVKVLANLDHPNIVKYYDSYSDKLLLHIVMEYCDGGDLSNYIKRREGRHLSEEEVMQKFLQVCLALHYVHRQGILHRDLKGSNIFLADSGIVKLGDFGISKVLSDYFAMAQSVVGTPNYLSPEICKSKPYGIKSDIWALGCVLYELCCLKPAFDGTNLPAVVIQILSGKYKPVPDVYSPELKKLLSRLLAKNPKNRPTLEEILAYDYSRHHLELYYRHVQSKVTRRISSFKNSLEHFNLDGDPSQAAVISIMTGLPLRPGGPSGPSDQVTPRTTKDSGWNKMSGEFSRTTSALDGASPQIKAHIPISLQDSRQFSETGSQAADLVSMPSSDTALDIRVPRPGSFLKSVQSDSGLHGPRGVGMGRELAASSLSHSSSTTGSVTLPAHGECGAGACAAAQAEASQRSGLWARDTDLSTVHEAADSTASSPGGSSLAALAGRAAPDTAADPPATGGALPTPFASLPSTAHLPPGSPRTAEAGSSSWKAVFEPHKVPFASALHHEPAKSSSPLAGSSKRLKVNFAAGPGDAFDTAPGSPTTSRLKPGRQPSRRERSILLQQTNKSQRTMQQNSASEALRQEQLQVLALVQAARQKLPLPPSKPVPFTVVEDAEDAVRQGQAVLMLPEVNLLHMFGSRDSQDVDGDALARKESNRSRTSTLSEETCALMNTLNTDSDQDSANGPGAGGDDDDDDDDDEEGEESGSGADDDMDSPATRLPSGTLLRHGSTAMPGSAAAKQLRHGTKREQSWELGHHEPGMHI